MSGLHYDSLADMPSGMQQLTSKKLQSERDRPAALPNQEAETKYHNQPTEEKGIRFQSKKESRRYLELMDLLRADKIRNLKLQHDFTLLEAYTTPQGVRIRAIRYKADFTYERPTKADATGLIHWIRVVEDSKSRPTRTKDYILKRKLMQEVYGITIQEV